MTRVKALTDRERGDLARLSRVISKAVDGGLERALRLAHDFDAMGHQTNTSDGTGRGSSGPSDPTAATVLRLNGARTDDDPDRWRTEPVMYPPLIAAARQLITAAQRLENCMDRVTAHSHADPENVNREEFCANPNCHEVIRTPTGDYPLSDRCSPCHWYRAEKGIDAPASVIADRLRKREERAKAKDTA